jgi:hypothetical protein
MTVQVQLEGKLYHIELIDVDEVQQVITLGCINAVTMTLEDVGLLLTQQIEKGVHIIEAIKHVRSVAAQHHLEVSLRDATLLAERLGIRHPRKTYGPLDVETTMHLAETHYHRYFPAEQIYVDEPSGRVYCGSEYLAQLRWLSQQACWDRNIHNAVFDRGK